MLNKLNTDKIDTRPRKNGWAPGNYMSKCLICNEVFIGDKRAFSCASCAYGDKTE